MEEFRSATGIIGIKIDSFKEGSVPIVGPDEPLQLLTLSHPKGKRVEPHTHRAAHRPSTKLEKCLIVRRGKLEIELYDESKKHVATTSLEPGQLFILLSGAWAVNFLENSEAYELKNGPFINDRIPF